MGPVKNFWNRYNVTTPDFTDYETTEYTTTDTTTQQTQSTERDFTKIFEPTTKTFDEDFVDTATSVDLTGPKDSSEFDLHPRWSSPSFPQNIQQHEVIITERLMENEEPIIEKSEPYVVVPKLLKKKTPIYLGK